MRPIVRRDRDVMHLDFSVPAAAEQREYCWPHVGTLVAIAALLACLGCWEEIHYAPKAEKSGVAGTAEPSPSAEKDEPPSSDELFAPQLPPSAATDDTASTASASEGPASAADLILPTPAESPETTTPESAAPGPVEPPAPTTPTPAERRLAWRVVSKWTLAAAIYAKGLPRSPHTPILEEATAAARELQLELPQLPAPAQPEDLEAAVIEGLRGELAVALRNAFASRFGEEAGAAADLAVRSHLLLLTYSPREADAAFQAEGLRRAGGASGLPAELWTPLATLVEQRAPFLDVRQAVFDLHRGADAHLAGAEPIAD